MAAPYSQLDFLAEDMLAAYLQQVDDPGVTIYKTLDADSMGDAVDTPCISIVALSAERAIPEIRNDEAAVANQSVQISVKVLTGIDAETSGGVQTKTARESHADLRGRVLDLFNRSTIVADLNALPVDGIVVQDIGWQNYSRRVVGNGIETDLLVRMDVYGEE
ncbi:MAG: hypothetical protein ABIH03_17145 [Pseudomonadota bacterium]